MKLRHIALCSVLSLTVSALPASADNLISVFKQAQISDPTFKQAQSVWMSARENLPIARAGYLPQVSITGTGTRSYNHFEPTTATVNTNGYFWSYGYGLTLSQPIFNAVNWAAIRGAKASVKAATATYSAAAQDLMVRTATAYFNVQKAYEKLRFTIANKRAVWRQLDTARQQFKVGLIAITGVYDAQSVYDQANAAEIADRNALDNAIENLRAITGVHYHVLKGIGARVPLVTPKPKNINEWVRIAELQSYALRAQEFTVVQAHEAIHQAAFGWTPQLALEGTWNTNFNTDFNRSQNIKSQQGTLGLAVTFPVIQGGLVIASARQARYNYLTATAQLEFTHRSVVNSARQSFLGVISGISQIKADRQSIISAQKAVEATKAGYAVGTRTMVDVLDDLQSLYQTQAQLADDQYNYLLSIITLKQAAGTLSMDDLRQINSWLRKTVRFRLSSQQYAIAKSPVRVAAHKATVPHMIPRHALMITPPSIISTSTGKATVKTTRVVKRKQHTGSVTIKQVAKKMSHTSKKTTLAATTSHFGVAKKPHPASKHAVKRAVGVKKVSAVKRTRVIHTKRVAKKKHSVRTTHKRHHRTSTLAAHTPQHPFVIQLYAATQASKATHFLNRNPEKRELRIIKQGRYYKVVYGGFDDQVDAEIALHTLPSTLDKYKPWVLHLSMVKVQGPVSLPKPIV